MSTTAMFGERNPYAERIGGDWFFDQVNTWHTGEVYLDGKSMYESLTLDGVEHPATTEDSFEAVPGPFSASAPGTRILTAPAPGRG